MNLKPTIGIETHIELNTNTKMFCRCKVVDTDEPNISLCPTCHKKLHKAQNQDRIPLLTKIFNEKNAEFKKIGINLNFQDLFDNYYN